jgi:CHAT domain-containing protein
VKPLVSPSADELAAQAASLLEPGARLPPVTGEAVALAWALKDLCYEAYSREPARAARAAEVLAALAAQSADQVSATEIQGLADWTAGIASLTRGEMAQAVQRFDAAALALRSVGRADEAAQTQVPKIMALTMLGLHQQALTCAEAAQADLRALGNVRAAARVSLNIGGICAHRDAYADAARHYREAAVLFARLRDHQHSVLADIGLVHSLRGLGDFDEAGRIQARARMRAANQGLELALAQLDESEALLDLTQGRYRQALAGLESARRRYELLDMPQCLAIAEKQLADAYLELRLLPEAWTLFDAALGKFAALNLPDEQAWALTQRGRAEAMLKQSAAQHSFALAARLFDAQGNAVGGAAVALAHSELALANGQLAAAAEAADAASRACEATGHAEGQARAEVLRAQTLLESGQPEAALRLFEAALERALKLQQLQVQVRCLTGRGLAEKAMGDLPAAARSFDAAIELFEDQRRALPGEEIRSAFLTDHLRPYQECLRLALEATTAGLGAAVLWQLERFRARSLNDELQESEASAQTADIAQAAAALPSPDAEFDSDSQVMRGRLNWLYHRFHRSNSAGDESPALREEMLRTERELLERARRIRLAAPARIAGDALGAQAANQLDSWSVRELQHALLEGDALIEYGVLDDELFACVVTPAGVALHRHLASWSAVLEAVRAARFQLETLRDGSTHLQRHLATLATRANSRLQRLHALLLAPLAPGLHKVQRLLVVAHAQLGAVPFAALHDGTQALGQRALVAMVPSARAALRGLLRPARAARQVLALGESTRLPHAATEAQSVARLFAQGLALVGEAATVQALRHHAGDADVVHLACHAQFRSDNPRFSALHLFDGALTVELAEALALRPCTVVLSACETALAEGGSGDEMVGLVRAFLVAGAARVVASLWPVDDAVTAGFMTAFYGALVGGMAPASALQVAQEITLQAHPHPCYWGAFTLYGGW